MHVKASPKTDLFFNECALNTMCPAEVQTTVHPDFLQSILYNVELEQHQTEHPQNPSSCLYFHCF